MTNERVAWKPACALSRNGGDWRIGSGRGLPRQAAAGLHEIGHGTHPSCPMSPWCCRRRAGQQSHYQQVCATRAGSPLCPGPQDHSRQAIGLAAATPQLHRRCPFHSTRYHPVAGGIAGKRPWPICSRRPSQSHPAARCLAEALPNPLRLANVNCEASGGTPTSRNIPSLARGAGLSGEYISVLDAHRSRVPVARAVGRA